MGAKHPEEMIATAAITPSDPKVWIRIRKGPVGSRGSSSWNSDDRGVMHLGQEENWRRVLRGHRAL